MFKVGDKVRVKEQEYIKYYINDNGYPPTEESLERHRGIKTIGDISIWEYQGFGETYVDLDDEIGTYFTLTPNGLVKYWEKIN